MNCKIEYVGKKRNGTLQYWCVTHKSIASDKNGNKLNECLYKNKELYNNILDLNKEKIANIKIIYDNIFESLIPKIYIDNQEFNGIFKMDDSILDYRDISGLMLAKINNTKLEKVCCNHCKHYHSDNGKFSYTPHKTHLCLYCGHLFKVKEANVGNEFELIFDIPDIILSDNSVAADNGLSIYYDLLNGKLLVNEKSANRIIFKKEEKTLQDFLNNIFINEY